MKRFPAEYEPHLGTLMIWPERPGSWGRDTSAAEKAFMDVITGILRSEKIFLLVNPGEKEYVLNRIIQYSAGKSLNNDGTDTMSVAGMKNDDADVPDEMLHRLCGLTVLEMETDDSWARDTGPTFLIIGNSGGNSLNGGNETDSGVRRLAVNWTFNAWGGTYDGLYAEWSRDDRVAKCFASFLGDEILDASPFVLEGGSIHTDGEGTLLVTESCLLSPGRNPGMTKAEIEEKLKEVLGAQKVLWLPRGIYMDETNEHVDNVAAFIRPGDIVLAWTDNKDDPQYELSSADLEYLMHETDAKGRALKVHKLPIPDVPVRCTKEDIDNYIFEPGEDEREEGERLAASYVNFYFANGQALVPQFGGDNKSSDERAVNILKELLPDREIVPIDARAILLGGGNIHCITQQIPLV